MFNVGICDGNAEVSDNLASECQRHKCYASKCDGFLYAQRDQLLLEFVVRKIGGIANKVDVSCHRGVKFAKDGMQVFQLCFAFGLNIDHSEPCNRTSYFTQTSISPDR